MKIRIVLYLGLLLACCAAGVAYQVSQSLKLSSGWGDGLCELDSFSTPSIAAAILKQEAARLFAACMAQPQGPEGAREREPRPIRQTGQPSDRESSASGQGPSGGSNPAAALQTAPLQPLQKLRQETWKLNSDLDYKLMSACYHSGLWDAYLDCYVRLLLEAPAHPSLSVNAPTALRLAAERRRTDEVLDAMRHLVRFHRDAKPAGGLGRILEEWEARHPHGVALEAR